MLQVFHPQLYGGVQQQLWTKDTFVQGGTILLDFFFASINCNTAMLYESGGCWRSWVWVRDDDGVIILRPSLEWIHFSQEENFFLVLLHFRWIYQTRNFNNVKEVKRSASNLLKCHKKLVLINVTGNDRQLLNLFAILGFSLDVTRRSSSPLPPALSLFLLTLCFTRTVSLLYYLCLIKTKNLNVDKSEKFLEWEYISFELKTCMKRQLMNYINGEIFDSVPLKKKEN